MPSFWKTPREIFRATFEREAMAEVDGKYVSAHKLHDKWHQVLLQEARVWEASGMQPEDLPVYEATVAPTKELIAASNAETLRLMLDLAARGKWFAVGRRVADKDEEAIPARYWPFLELDMKNATAKGEGMQFRALRCAFIADVPADDPIRTEIERANSMQPALPTKSATVAPAARRRGPAPQKLLGVKAAMADFDRAILDAMTEEAMVAQFKASRDTCRRARRELSEFK
ncbi:hypothetical protein [Mesorhizobium sp. BR1-1-4]|uniref:hypothetical protein n=1 Tax=Mesorhizobium sp. BR1-1-4 TaxID=2876650 RepID=UPI001CCA544E|nr:hypothetical protein [Mesorhizobium sp. BR1-1-4]MBZ9927747.1 hypothetical protein [Mesorhizobium sp. BR1-1-4]